MCRSDIQIQCVTMLLNTVGVGPLVPNLGVRILLEGQDVGRGLGLCSI